MVPADVVDYVVIHELAHLKEKNHTDRFWRIVGKYDPDYVDHGDWLDENSARMVFSDEDM